MGGFLNPPIHPYNIPAPFLLAWCLYKSLGGELWKPCLVPPYLKTSCGVGETKEAVLKFNESWLVTGRLGYELAWLQVGTQV